MTASLTLDRETAAPKSADSRRPTEDMAMLRAAAELTRDLNAPRPLVYWGDFVASAVTGYAALFAAMTLASTGWAVAAAVVSVLALYRAGSFIHELTHVKHANLPWFRLGYNALIGVPMFVPSFMYEGVHNLHHARTRYGTSEDPEYLPLALMKPYTLPLFVVAALLAPVALLFRFAVLAPLSLLSPGLRTIVVARFSGLAINPAFRRRPAEGALRNQWIALETAASLWSIALLGSVAFGVVPLRALLIFLGVAAGVAVINQVRTLVAHLWENDGDAMSQTAQYLDSVNVPPPTLLPALWAPVGLRYHGVHHLLPGLPYHALGEAHRRLTKALEADSHYHRGHHSGLPELVTRLVGSTLRKR